MNWRRGEYWYDRIYWQHYAAAAAVVRAWQPQKVVGGPSGGLWLADKKVHETCCDMQSSSDLTYPAMVFGLPVLGRIIVELCLFKGNIRAVLSKWVKNDKGLLQSAGEAY